MAQELNKLIEVETKAGRQLINADQLSEFMTKYPGLKIVKEEVAGVPEQSGQTPAAEGDEPEADEPGEEPVA